MYFQITPRQWLVWVQKAHPAGRAVGAAADFVGRSQINLHPSSDLQIGHLEVELWWDRILFVKNIIKMN
jgi:hypothetical protein